MKYSILFPYYDRATQFDKTLQSFIHHYSDRDDYEIIVIEDHKNVHDSKFHKGLMDVISKYEDKLTIKYIEYTRENVCNPAEMFNIGVRESDGEFIVLTNPEMVHETNVLGYYDKKLEEDNTLYVVSTARNVKNLVVGDKITYKHVGWYAHPEKRNVPLHFCSVISKEVYNTIGGFDEEYIKGIAYEDTDFIKILEKHDITIDFTTKSSVLHQEHPKNYRNQKLWNINKAYYNDKWR